MRLYERIRGDDVARFFSRVIDATSSDCRNWVGRKHRGYGLFDWRGPQDERQRPYLAHRWIYEQEVGPIPDGWTLDHLCHNLDSDCRGGGECSHRSCIHVPHLTPKPLGENARDGMLSRARCRRGHLLIEGVTFYWAQGSRRCRKCEAIRVAARLERGLPINHRVTHCKRGHLYDEENTYVKSDGSWHCRTCHRERNRLRNQERRENNSSL
jgi:hypothetical protein